MERDSLPLQARVGRVNVRPYHASDWPRLCEVHDAARRQELALSGGDDAFLTLEQTAHAEGLFDGRLDVAEVGGHVLGFVAYTPDRVRWLYVAPPWQCRGLGRALLRHACREAGPVVTCEVLVGNEPALALCRSERFEVVQQLEGRLAGNPQFPVRGWVLERRRISE